MPRARQASAREYHPFTPPMPSITRHSASGGAPTTWPRSSAYRLPPAQSGSVGSGSLGAPGVEADDQRVATSASLMRWRASRTARSNPISPSSGSGTYRAMSCSRQTTSLRSDSTSGRASAGRYRGDQADPVAGQAGRQQRHRDDQPGRQAGRGGVALHHLRVREDVRAADVERPVGPLGNRHGADEVAQHVPDRDRLDAGAHPARRRHDRQPLGEVAQHLEGRRSRADDHRGPESHRRHRRSEQDPLDLRPRPQVRRGPLPRAQAAEVDDAPHPGGLGRRGERGGRLAVALGEVAAGRHRVDQVVRDVHAFQGRPGLLRPGRVRLRDLHPAAPRPAAQPVGRAHHAAHVMARRQQFGYQPPADVAGRAGHQTSGHHTTPVPCLRTPWPTRMRPAPTRSVAGAGRADGIIRARRGRPPE